MTSKTYALHIDGCDFFVTKKQMKSIRMRACAQTGDIKVSAPHYVNKQDVTRFISHHIEWAKNQREAVKKIIEKNKPSLEHDIQLFDKSFKLNVTREISRKKLRIIIDENIVDVFCGENTNEEDIFSALDKWKRAHLLERITEYVDYYSPKMAVSVTKIGIRKMRTRWGSCNITAHRISLNAELANKPLHCLEYVVVHELAHLIEANHTPRFWRVVESFMPSWKAAHDYLNKARS